MAEQRKDRDRETGADRSAAVAYSSRDLDHFARLSDFSSYRRAAEAGTGGAGPGPSDAAAFAYSDGDARLFSRLMDDLGLVLGVAARSRATRAGRDYTARDDEQFSVLMEPERFAAGGSAAPRGAGPSRDPGDAVVYTASDAAAFARIMPESAAAEETGGDGESWLPSREDRDVGPIRVVDFGKEQDRSGRRGRPGEGAIKVRYFD